MVPTDGLGTPQIRWMHHGGQKRTMDAENYSPISFGALLRHHRQTARLTQKELAACAGVSEHSISNLERGAPHAPRPDLVQLLARALQLSPQEEGQLQAAAKAIR